MGKLFRGGAHPNDRKGLTAKKAVENGLLPDKVIIPMAQHIGAECVPVVKKGDLVKKGQVIGTSEAYVSSPVHASISGKVINVGEYPDSVKGKAIAVEIESDGLDEWMEGLPIQRDWKALDRKELLNIIRQAGIVGMGGATFPTHVKLAPPEDKKIECLILNGAECEPYLTSDHRVMLEQSDRIVTGTLISMKILGLSKCYVGIEENKPDAVEVMKKAFAGTNVEVKALPTRYPQGAEKMLIKAVVEREVPCGGLPMDVGVVVQNVATVAAMADAVCNGLPLIERVVSITGEAVAEPKNLLLRVGTTFRNAVEQCGGIKNKVKKIVSGGPMMGIAQYTLDVPVTKGTSGILLLTPKEVGMARETNCINCGKCVEACPMGLTPNMFGTLGKLNLSEEAKEEYGLLNCGECGTCAFVCPGKRNIVQYIRQLKSQNAAAQKKENKG